MEAIFAAIKRSIIFLFITHRKIFLSHIYWQNEYIRYKHIEKRSFLFFLIMPPYSFTFRIGFMKQLSQI